MPGADTSIWAQMVHVDWSEVRLKRALGGVAAILAVVAFLGLFGDLTFVTAIAALFVTAAAGDGPIAARLPGMVRFTIIGALLGGLAYGSTGSVAAVAVVLGAATYVGTLAAAFGTVAARRGLLLTLWALLALLLGSVETAPWQAAAAFAIGGIVAMAITAIRLRATPEDEATDPAAPADGRPMSERLVAAAQSDLGRFAVVRTGAVVLAVLVGFWWFSSHPFWAAITVIVIVRPSAEQTMAIGVQRTLGTALGAGVAVAVAQVFPQSDVGVAFGFMVSAAAMVAFVNANYTVFAAALTAMLVFSQRLVEQDAFDAGWQRLLATAVGAGVAFGAIAFARWLGARTARPA